LKIAIAKERIAFVPGAAFYADGSNPNTIRLAFALQSETAIREGIRRLGSLIAEYGVLPEDRLLSAEL